jgi:hypothetical protein
MIFSAFVNSKKLVMLVTNFVGQSLSAWDEESLNSKRQNERGCNAKNSRWESMPIHFRFANAFESR